MPAYTAQRRTTSLPPVRRTLANSGPVKLRACVQVCLLACLPALALAETAPPDAPDMPPSAGRQPLWEAGLFAGGGSQQAYPGAKQQVNTGIVLPFVLYRGKWLRAEQGGIGVRAVRTATTEVDVGFGWSFGSSANNSDVRRGLPNIGTLVEFGPRLKQVLAAAPGGGAFMATLPVRGVFDLSHGFGFKGVSAEPTLGWGARDGAWGYGASVGLLFGSGRLTDTFYGVAPVYATSSRPAYQAKAGLIATRLSVSLSRNLGPDWRLFAYARADSVGGAANRNSPLVDRTVGPSVGIGLAWTGLRSSEAAQP